MVKKDRQLLHVMVDKKDLKHLHAIADEMGFSLSNYMRILIRQHLKTPLKIAFAQKAS